MKCGIIMRWGRDKKRLAGLELDLQGGTSWVSNDHFVNATYRESELTTTGEHVEEANGGLVSIRSPWQRSASPRMVTYSALHASCT